jgi:hypothetical protein
LFESKPTDVAGIGLVIGMYVEVLLQILLGAEVLAADMSLEERHTKMIYLGMSSEVEATAVRLPTVVVWAHEYDLA